MALAGVESSQRLRLNQLLNTSGKMGRGAGNALGVLGLLFASFESFAGYITNGQVPDEVIRALHSVQLAAWRFRGLCLVPAAALSRP